MGVGKWVVGQSEFTWSWWGRRRAIGMCGPWKSHKTHNIQYSTVNRIRNTENRIPGTAAAKLMYIKLPMYLFFIWRLDLMIVMGANPFREPLEGGPNGTRFACGYFRAKNFSVFSIYIWIYSTQQQDQKRTDSLRKSDLCNLITQFI